MTPKNGRIEKAYSIAFPADVESIDIFELATDDRDCVVLTAEVEVVPPKVEGENVKEDDEPAAVVSRRLYRFWLSDHQ